MNQYRPSSDARWEYHNLVIPLNLRLNDASYPTRRQLEEFQGCDGIVTGFLNQAARDGWEADEPADWDSLAAAGRLAIDLATDADEPGALGYTAVTIRVKRVAQPDRPSGPVEGAAQAER